jgi:hypothetical protein
MDTIMLHGEEVVLGRRRDDGLRNSSHRYLDQRWSWWFDGMMYYKVCRDPHALQDYLSVVLPTLS